MRRMEAMEQIRVEYEQRAAAQMHEAFASAGATPPRSWRRGEDEGEDEGRQEGGQEEGEEEEEEGLGTMLASGGRALRKSLSFRGSSGGGGSGDGGGGS